MSALTALTAVDERLAAQIDRVTAAVEAVGSRTAAARDRLAHALHQARARLASQMASIADLVEMTIGVFDEAVLDDLLALPVPEPDHVAQAGQFVACEEDRVTPVKMQFEKPLTILNPDADPKTLSRATPLPAWDQSDGVMCEKCGTDFGSCPCVPSEEEAAKGVATPEPDMAERVTAALAARPRSLDTLVNRLVSDDLVGDQASEAEEKAASVNRVAEALEPDPFATATPWENEAKDHYDETIKSIDDPVNRVAEAPANREPEHADLANGVKDSAHAMDKADNTPPNGRPRSRRKK